jgi:hypothetical protein
MDESSLHAREMKKRVVVKIATGKSITMEKVYMLFAFCGTFEFLS